MPSPNIGKQPDTSAVPPSIRRQAEQADRLMREARGEPAEPNTPPPNGEPPPPAEPPEGPTHPEPPRGHQQAQPPQEPPREPPPPPADDPNSETYKQKFESSQGRIRKLTQDISNMSTEIGKLHELLAAVQAAPPAQSAQPTSPVQVPDVKDILSPEEVAEWGEMLPIIEKVTKAQMEVAQRQFDQRLQQTEQQVTRVTQHNAVNAYQKMLEALDSPTNPINKSGRQFGPTNGSTWRDINEDPEFIEWLQYPDPLSGQKREAMILEAFKANDATRVGAFFANFLREVAAVDPQQPSQPASKPGVTSQGNGGGRPSLDQFAAPGRPREAAPSSGPAEAPFMTTGDISRFYSDKARGRWKGREKEADAYEQQIWAAKAAGRITNGPPSP